MFKDSIEIFQGLIEFIKDLIEFNLDFNWKKLKSGSQIAIFNN
jgi:hypothetical protein